MNKILEYLKPLLEKWKALSKPKRIGIIVISSAILLSLIISIILFTRTQYDVLFSNLDTTDQAKIYQKLKDDKVDVQISGNSLLVPKNNLETIRMSVYSSGLTPSGTKGFEIFDSQQFGVTDTEEKVMYQRALEGELARTIMSLDGVQNAIVHIVLPEDTVFAKDTSSATASVTIKMKDTEKLDTSQVKAIVALVSSSVKDLPKQNVQVVDGDMNNLTDGLYDDTTAEGTMAVPKQQMYQKQFEQGLQTDIKNMLESVFGKDKVKVRVNADLNFDSNETTSIVYDPKDVVLRSTQTNKNSTTDNSGSGSTASGVTSNLPGTSYPGQTSSGGSSSTSNQDDTIINNEIGQTQSKVVKAPGEVQSIATSVLIDGKIDSTEKTEITNIVAAATGYNADRGDQINISALPFNHDQANQVKADLAAMQKQELQASNMKKYIGIGAAAALLLAIVFVLLRKKLKARKARKLAELDLGEGGVSHAIDVLIDGETGAVKRGNDYTPVLGEDEEENMTLEKEIKEYATKKPDQVVDVIKSWLSEDERG